MSVSRNSTTHNDEVTDSGASHRFGVTSKLHPHVCMFLCAKQQPSAELLGAHHRHPSILYTVGSYTLRDAVTECDAARGGGGLVFLKT